MTKPTPQQTMRAALTAGLIVIGAALCGAAALRAFSVDPDIRRVSGRQSSEQACTPAAQTCAVQLELVAELQTPETVLLPVAQAVVGQDSAERFLIVSRDRRTIAVFDRSGQFVSGLTTPSPQGSSGGRGVFISHLVASLDNSTWAYRSDRSLVEIASATSFGRSVRVAYPPAFRRGDGSLVVAAQIAEPDLVGQPIHMLEADGAVTRSFGLDVPEYRRDLHMALSRVVAPGSDGSVWSIAPGRYVIERWKPEEGVRLESINIKSEWFVASDRLVSDQSVRPSPLVQALWEEAGLLVVLTRVADANWQAPLVDPNVERPFDSADYNRRFDWIVEAVDRENGEVVASRRLAEAHWASLSSGLLSSLTLSSDGEVGGVNVWKVRVINEGGGA